MQSVRDYFKNLQSYEQLPGFLEDAGLWVWDFSESDLNWNIPVLVKMLGYSTESFSGSQRNKPELISPRDRNRLREAAKAHIADPCICFDQVFYALDSGGRMQWIRMKGMVAGVNMPATLLVSFQNTTLQMLAGSRSVEDAAVYRYILQANLLYIAKTDLSGNYTYVNDYYAQTIGRTARQMIGTAASEGVDPDDLQNGLDAFERCINDPGSEQIVVLGRSDYAQQRLNLEWTFVALRNGIGEVYEVLCLGRDNTAYKKAQDHLSRTEEILEQTARMAHVGGWEFDPSDRSLFWSKVTREIYERDPYELITLQSLESHYIKPLDSDKIRQAALSSQRDGLPWDIEGQIITAKGNLKWIRSIGRAVMDGGVCSRILGTVQDITDRKSAQLSLIRTSELLEQTGRMAKVGGWELVVADKSLYWTDVTVQIHELDPGYIPVLSEGIN
ncbi:MAG TPA: PAS domain-containing protein, partial [Dyadobacter sp.]|nr:PAS domain-containing protein [Dyadobacter sp.]